MIVLTIVNTVVFALSTNDITVSYPTYGFYLKGNPITYAVTINGDENNPSTVKVYYPYNTYNSQPRVLLKTLSRNGNYYSGTSSPTTWVPGRKAGSHGLWETRGFCIQATKEGTTVRKKASGYLTGGNLSFYTNVDSTFYYNTPTDNSFLSVGTPAYGEATPTYNCLAFSVSVNNEWMWPWNSNPTASELDAFMSKTGNYSSRNGDVLEYSSSLNNCDVIYYSNYALGNGTDGHFAKVCAWNSSGTPTIVRSKWGNAEVIQSSSYNPFTGNSYGSPKRYYKYPD
ncbi:MAG: hypothetical protein IJS38_01640 [Erysipelotrichaceae bacterium]|nr:hypothetical protein [Erysipelotrichaceae bacterium]